MACNNCVQGAVFYLHSMCLGILFGVIGPSIPDLRCSFGVSLQVVTSLVLWFGLGGVSGQVLVAVLLKKMSTYLLLALLITLSSLSTALVPVSGNIYFASLLLYIAGLSTGQGMSVLVHQMNVVWPENAKIVHLLFASAALGPAFGPLILAPFLSSGAVTMSLRKTFNVKKSDGFEHFKFNTSDDYMSTATGTIMAPYPSTTEHINTTDPCQGAATLIQYPYLMFAFMGLPAIAGHLFFHYKERQLPEYDIMPNQEASRRTIPEWFYIALKCTYFILVHGIMGTYSSLLTTFGYDGSLQLSLNQMALMTSTFWFSFTAGRVSPSLLPNSFKHVHFIIAVYVVMFIGHVCLLLAQTNVDLLWFSTVLIGSSTGPALSAGLIWSRETIAMSPNIITAYIAFTQAGFVLSTVCGYLMGEYGPNTFVYFIVGIFALNIIVLASLIILTKYI